MTSLSSCVCCGTLMPAPFLDLGIQPLANSYHKEGEALPCYPLAVTQCDNCTHRQLTVAVDPAEMFRTYLYVSGTSDTLRRYFAEFAGRVVQECGGDARVLDIGCNDGSLLEALLPYVAAVRGVDP